MATALKALNTKTDLHIYNFLTCQFWIKKFKINKSEPWLSKFKVYGYAVQPKISMKSRVLMFCYVPATSAYSSKGVFVAATNSTNQTNKAGSTCY